MTMISKLVIVHQAFWLDEIVLLRKEAQTS